MQQAVQADSGDRKPKNKKRWRPPKWARITLVVVGLLFCLGLIVMGLVIASLYLNSTSDPVQFVTGNLLNALVFVAITAQVLIYREQWHVMERQLEAMNRQAGMMSGQLGAMDRQSRAMTESLYQNQRAVEAAEKNVEIARDSYSDARNEAYHQREMMQRQLELMGEQAKAMQDSLAETRRIFDLTERPIIVVEHATIPDIANAQGKALIPVITVANRGRTAAKRLTITIRVFAKSGWDLTQELPSSDTRTAHIHFLAANDSTGVSGDESDAIYLDGPLHRGIMAGHQFCVIFVSGTYRDLSGEREYPIDEYVFSYYAKTGHFVTHHYEMANKEKREEQRAAADKKQENPT